MFGRSGFDLLAIPILILTPLLLNGQADRARLSPKIAPQILPDFTPDFAPGRPRIHPPPTPGPSPVPPGTLNFPGIARAAGMIFSGTVARIERRPATRGQAVETVAVTFHVENALRGASSGENLTISQWIGLWSGGQRYRLGERVVVFLYPPSKLGLTSCVAGPMGRFDMDGWGRVLLSAHQLSVFRSDPLLGGKSRVSFVDFALAVRRASEDGEE